MPDCIVIGGGLIGMLTARALHESGVDVLLLERNVLGGESTWAGGGILSPLYPWRYPDAVTELARYGQAHYKKLAQTIWEESGIDPEYTQSGMLVLDLEEQDQALSWARVWQSELNVIGNGQLYRQEPVLSKEYQTAIWMPDIAQLRNPRLIKSLRGSFIARGISFKEGEAVTQLKTAGGRIQGVVTNKASYNANMVLVAGGAWTAKIFEQLSLKLPHVEPVKGQMILFRAKPGLLNSIVLSEGRYLIPRRDGRILAGSTLEHTGFEKFTTVEAKSDLYTAAIRLAPELGQYEIEHQWAGLRPGSSLGIPYICPHPEIEGLYINSGHFRNGVILGAASARLMADLITGAKPAIDPAFYGFDAMH